MGTFAKSQGLDKKTFDKKRKLFDNQLGRQFVIFPDIRFPLHYDIDGVHVNEKMAEFHADLKRLYATIFSYSYSYVYLQDHNYNIVMNRLGL